VAPLGLGRRTRQGGQVGQGGGQLVAGPGRQCRGQPFVELGQGQPAGGVVLGQLISDALPLGVADP